MMKKVCIILMILVICISSAGCGEKKQQELQEETAVNAQPYWNTVAGQSVTRSENGYYYWANKITLKERELGKLCYMDAQTQDTTVVCSNADCTHSSSACAGNFPLADGYHTDNLYYYKDYIYVQKDNKEDGYTYLEQVTSDGSNRKTLFEIGTVDGAYNLVFYDDAVFIYDRISGRMLKDTGAFIRRRSLNGREDEKVFEYSGSGITISAVKNYGDRMYFTVTEQMKTEEIPEDAEKMSWISGSGIFVYDINNRQTEKLIDEDVSDFTIDLNRGNIYYFVRDDGIYRRALNGGPSERIYPCEKGINNYSQISTDGEYLYVSNDEYCINDFLGQLQPYLWVLDMNGAVINQIKSSEGYVICFGDEQFLFARTENLSNIKYISKSEIETAKEWTRVDF